MQHLLTSEDKYSTILYEFSDECSKKGGTQFSCLSGIECEEGKNNNCFVSKHYFYLAAEFFLRIAHRVFIGFIYKRESNAVPHRLGMLYFFLSREEEKVPNRKKIQLLKISRMYLKQAIRGYQDYLDQEHGTVEALAGAYSDMGNVEMEMSLLFSSEQNKLRHSAIKNFKNSMKYYSEYMGRLYDSLQGKELEHRVSLDSLFDIDLTSDILQKLSRRQFTGNIKYETSVQFDNLPQGIEFPEALSPKIRYDSGNKYLTCRGVMSENEKEELVELSKDEDYKKAVDELFKKSKELMNIVEKYKDMEKRGFDLDEHHLFEISNLLNQCVLSWHWDISMRLADQFSNNPNNDKYDGLLNKTLDTIANETQYFSNRLRNYGGIQKVNPYDKFGSETEKNNPIQILYEKLKHSSGENSEHLWPLGGYRYVYRNEDIAGTAIECVKKEFGKFIRSSN